MTCSQRLGKGDIRESLRDIWRSSSHYKRIKPYLDELMHIIHTAIFVLQNNHVSEVTKSEETLLFTVMQLK